MMTLLLNGKHLSVTSEEAQALQPLLDELSGLSGRAFAHDPPVWAKPPPFEIVTPSKIRAMIEKRIGHLARVETLTARILDAFTVNGARFHDIEGGARIPTQRVEQGPRSRLFR